MTQTVKKIYKNIIEQVVLIEKNKKEISSYILMSKDSKKKLEHIYNFLNSELDKQELLEYAAVLALSNREDAVINNLQQLYAGCEKEELIDKIRTEIKHTKQFLHVINKGRKYSLSLSFFERRMIQEISKYVIEQAKIYRVT